MRITITAEAANDPAAHAWLDRIVARIEDGWHVWDTAEPPAPEAMEGTSWFLDPGRQGRRLRELWRRSIQKGAWSLEPHERRLRVTTRPVATDESKPEDAFRPADEPLVLLVENRESDGAFLKRIVGELDRRLHSLWNRAGHPIRVDSVGGGGQMPLEIERRSLRLARRLRLVAIIDSDRKGPSDGPGPTARALRRECESRGVACWILAKREAENYLPRALLDARPDAGPDHARQVEAWDRLGDDQKDFFDLKGGWSSQPSPAEESLFHDVSPDDREMLRNGFGSRLHSCWSCGGVEVRSELVDRSRGDLEEGMKLIRSQV